MCFLKWVIIAIQFICLDFKCATKASEEELFIIYRRLLILGTEWKYVFISAWKYQAVISQSSANIIWSLGFYKIYWIKWKKIQWTILIPVMQCSSNLCLNSTSLYFAAPINVHQRVISFGFYLNKYIYKRKEAIVTMRSFQLVHTATFCSRNLFHKIVVVLNEPNEHSACLL